MKVVAVANQKGGTGKTTVAFNLAVAAMRDGLKTLVVNADLQQSIIDVALARANNGIAPSLSVANIISDKLHQEIHSKYPGYDLAIVDTGGRDSRAFRSAIAAADVLIIPLLPSAVDIWASQGTIKIAQDIASVQPEPMQTYCLLNQQVRNTVIGNEVVSVLADIGVPTLKTILYHRTAYKRSLSDGRSVIEHTDRQATREVESLWEEICTWL